mgnify:FL=1
MRTIKFRGRSATTKIFVYGFYCKQGNTGLPKILTFKKGFQGFYPVVVEEDSIAQLCGYDKNGKEVYEGDTLIDDIGEEYIARIYDPPQCISDLMLKEPSHD